MDRDNDGTADTPMFGTAPDEPPTGLLFDLDQDSPATFSPKQLPSKGGERKWDFEFALHLGAPLRTFYDTNNDGRIDLVLTGHDEDGVADHVLRLKDGTWRSQDPARRKVIDISLVAGMPLRIRFRHVMDSLLSFYCPISVDAT
ncbi:MAG TPA: hypothetical protein EYH34_03190, partial [Planctomycetes bacterium]|nr:hypothetical protein [Planctomycetota bacterium]